MPKLTIHTATYNRAYILSKAYESLRNQTCKDFEWIITDDGSTDGTDNLVKKWIYEDNEFLIIYNKLNHVGIPRALNSGINLANSDWFMMLDSDDALKPETVEKVLRWIEQIKDNISFAGIGFAKCYPNGEFMKPQIPDIKDGSYIDATNIERRNYHIDMDMCEVQRLSLYKKYPFQYWKDESYAPEQLNYNQIALAGYKIRWRKEKLYICEYLPDGQTMDDKLVKKKPMGFAMMYNQNILLSESFGEKAKNVVRMSALALYAKQPSYVFKSNAKLLSMILFPFSFALSIRRKRQYKQIDD